MGPRTVFDYSDLALPPGESMRALRRGISFAWSKRRWAFAAYIVYAITRIPARTGFRLIAPACDTRITLENIGLSLTKVPHVVLFGFFFLLIAMQFDRVDRKTVAWSVVATAAMGLIIELEEGATRTGHCRLTDVLPGILGALVAGLLLMSIAAVYRRARSSDAKVDRF